MIYIIATPDSPKSYDDGITDQSLDRWITGLSAHELPPLPLDTGTADDPRKSQHLASQ